jgi:hypothetical protein
MLFYIKKITSTESVSFLKAYYATELYRIKRQCIYVKVPQKVVTLSSETLISHVAVWKQLHLNECLSKTGDKLSWKRSRSGASIAHTSEVRKTPVLALVIVGNCNMQSWKCSLLPGFFIPSVMHIRQLKNYMPKGRGEYGNVTGEIIIEACVAL